MTTGWYAKPEWVIVGGVRDDGKVMLIASTKLNRAVLDVRRDYVRYPDSSFRDFRYAPLETECTLSVMMPAFTVQIADTYEEALRRLFTQWSPTGTPQKAIGPGVLAIEDVAR